MIKSAVYIILIIALLSQPLFAQSKTQFSIAPSIKYGLGYTEYIMDLNYYDSDEDEFYRIKSHLEFPLDIMIPGVRFGVQSMLDDRLDWSATAEVHFNANNPGDKMTDRDWQSPLGYPLVEISNTESDVELNALLVSFRVEKQVLSRPKFDLYLILGFDYQKLDFDIYGYSGWQYDDAGIRRTVYGTEKAMDYEVKYTAPLFGLAGCFNQSGRTVLNVEADFGPVFVSDLDDHVLRNKIAEADGTGYTVGLSCNSRFYFDFNGRQKGAYIDIGAEVQYFSASTDQTQRWYGDDPATDNYDDTGSYIANIPHDIKSLQYRIGLKIGMLF